MGVGGQIHAPAASPPGKRPGAHCTGGWVEPKPGLVGCEKSLPIGIRSSDRPARSDSYRLSCRGPPILDNTSTNYGEKTVAYRGLMIVE